MPPVSPSDLRVEVDGNVAKIRLGRAEKRNALNLELVNRLGQYFAEPPPEVRAAVLLGDGAHFCAGLDLAENRDRTVFEAMENSNTWHRAFDCIERGRIPVVAALHGAVIGGGLELALAAHVRVADSSSFYALPEGRLGIFVGGGGSVRIARVLGADRMREMMLTGRRLTSEDGQRLGISHELVADGEATIRAHEVAAQLTSNAPLANQLILARAPPHRRHVEWRRTVGRGTRGRSKPEHRGRRRGNARIPRKTSTGLPRHLSAHTDALRVQSRTQVRLLRRLTSAGAYAAAAATSLPQCRHLVAGTGRSPDRQKGQVLVGAGSPKTVSPRRAM